MKTDPVKNPSHYTAGRKHEPLYDAKLRKSRGVYYTPEPVVNFIVRAVDDILINEFKLSKGLADTSKVTIKKKMDGTADKKGKDVFENVDVHKIQILDPATGTGTFLEETVKQIYSKFKGQEGLWSAYVESDLIPRINGFEILMASYTMCHLKIEMLLRETGYKPKNENKQPRLKVFLTNSLEEAHPDTGNLFASWLSKESTEANYVKRDTPVMVVIGNPPYANFGQMNQGEWIKNLISDYKKNLNEKKINLDDDYIKFIRYGQHYIEKNGSGILAYISNNSFIDGVTHRQMRKHLIDTFDRIYIIDLHGNSLKKEISPDGSNDVNVFDIQQGVSINIFIKKNKENKNNCKVYHTELFGSRELKYDVLFKSTLKSLNFNKIIYESPYFFFVPKSFDSSRQYENGFSLEELFIVQNSGIKTDRDDLFINDDKQSLTENFQVLLSGKYDDEFKSKYRIVDSGSYKITKVIQNIKFNQKHIKKIVYRPFDEKFTYYDPKLVSRPAFKSMKHLIDENNICLCFMRQYAYNCDYCYAFVTDKLVESRVFISNKGIALTAPLYLISDDINLKGEIEHTPNFKPEIFNKIQSNITKPISPENLFDYIYAVIHSPTYRHKFSENLKIDYPRIPYPKNEKIFWELVSLGNSIRLLHLFQSSIIDNFITKYPVSGSNYIEKINFTDGVVQINNEQYFEGIPDKLWNFYIGGYQPAQKWLKDRKGKELSTKEIMHYQRIIIVLAETERIMKEIDEKCHFQNEIYIQTDKTGKPLEARP